ncbi:hypothetical protein KQH82_13520 [bacterium]|nr:hypothetical protein [bacterium]
MSESPIKTPRTRKAPRSEAREYCFVIMSYRPRSQYDRVYQQLCQLIESNCGLRCVRADREPEPGRDLLGKVHEKILGSSVVVADVTEYSPNVYYEYGYASAHDRLPILIAKRGARLPTDLVGKEVLRYKGTPAVDRKFSKDLIDCVNRELCSPLPEQRRMLASARPFPAYLATAPRVPGAGSKHWWHPDEGQTFGDMLGVAGILTAYGNLFGTRKIPHLLHAQCVHADVLALPASFFCIGSPKVNKVTGHFLPWVQRGLVPFWEMPRLGRKPDRRVVIKGDPDLDDLLKLPVEKKRDGSISDYGLIIRAPHPLDSQHLVLIMAGRHSIGTHAACMMVTRQELISALELRLKRLGVSLRETAQPFWGVVRGTLLSQGEMLSEVEIVKVGGYVPG